MNAAHVAPGIGTRYVMPAAVSFGLVHPLGRVSRNTGVFSTVTRDLAEAREDLRATGDEAIAMGYPLPSKRAFENAVSLLTTMYEAAPQRFEVYPTPDGEIAIDSSPAPGRSVIVLCDSDGEVLTLRYRDGRSRSKRYRSLDQLSARILRGLFWV